MRQFCAFFSISLKDAFVYRARGLIWFLVDLIPVLTSIFFLSAVFSQERNLGGYSWERMMIYYFVVLALDVLVISHPEFIMAQDINQGFLNTYLIRPLSYLRLRCAFELGYKAIRLLYLLPLLLLIFLFLPQVTLTIPFGKMALFLLMMVNAYSGYYLLKAIVGITSFWATEIWWLISTLEVANILFAGLMIPLDLMPIWVQKIASFLPFQYFIYFPAQFLLRSMPEKEVVTGIGFQALWLLILWLSLQWLWVRGIKHYTAFGG